VGYKLSDVDFQRIMELTKGYSSADLNSVVKEAAMGPVREIPAKDFMSMKPKNAFRKIRLHDFEQACIAIRPSVSKGTLMEY